MTAMVLASVLVVPGTAMGGGWATVELSSTPDGLEPGETWKAEMTVLQHGRTPLEGVEPAVTVTEGGGTTVRTYRARPTKRPGVYRFSVAFPRAGEWEYVVDDGFSQRHSYPPVQIGEAATAAPAAALSADETAPIWQAMAAALAAGLLAAGLTVAVQRRRPAEG
jgi:hypothetical protein